MPVRVVSSPFHRLRCVSCTQRVSALQGPFFDFGGLEDGPVELLERDKKQHHDDVLVCAGCVRRAAGMLPGAKDAEAAHRREVKAAQDERDRAIKLAGTLAREVHMKLDDAIPSSDHDPRAQSNVTLPTPETKAPPQLAPSNEAVPADTSPDFDLDPDELESMTVRQLRGLARERGIAVPGDVQSKQELVDHLSDALTAPPESE